MKKILSLLFIIVLFITSAQVVNATIAASWASPSSSSGYIYPNPINSVNQRVSIGTTTAPLSNSSFLSVAGNAHFGTSTCPYPADTLMSPTWEFCGNDNTDNGVNLSLANVNPGGNAFSDIFFQNDASVSSSTFAVMGMNSSNYDSTTYGTLSDKPNQFQVYTTQGPLTLAAASNLVDFPTTTAYINFATGGLDASNERMRIQYDGKVGIGTTNPYAQLNVVSSGDDIFEVDANTDGGEFPLISTRYFSGAPLAVSIGDIGDYFNGNTVVTDDGNGNMTLNAAQQLQFSSSANIFNSDIGIGTTTPGTILSIGNTGANTINISNTATSTFGHGINVQSGCYAVSGTCIGGSTLTGTTGQTAYFKGTNSAIGTSSLFIATNQNVGIGTTTPGSKLTVAGKDVSADTTQVQFENPTDYTQLGLSNSAAPQLTRFSQKYDGLSFWENNLNGNNSDTKDDDSLSAWRMYEGDNNSGFNAFGIQTDAEGDGDWADSFYQPFTIANNGVETMSGTSAGDDGSLGQLTITPDWYGGGGAWINLPTDAPSGIGTGGPGSNPFLAYVSSGGQWFNNSVEGATAYRNNNELEFGSSDEASGFLTMKIIDDGEFHIEDPEQDSSTGNDCPTFSNTVDGSGQIKIGDINGCTNGGVASFSPSSATFNNDNILTTGTTRIGIGTSTPSSPLSVSTLSQQSGLLPLLDVASTTGKSLLKVLGNGYVGIGTSTPTTALVSVAASSTVASTAYNGLVSIVAGFEGTTVKLFQEIDQWGHLIVSGDAPTLTACTGGSVGSNSNDRTGSVTLGTGLTSCGVLFKHSYPTGTVVHVFLNQDSGTIVSLDAQTISITGFTITSASILTGDSVSYDVIASQ